MRWKTVNQLRKLLETEFDSKAQAVVHWSVDAVTGQDSTTLRQLKGWRCLMTKHGLSGQRPGPKTRVEWCMMSCRMRTRKIRRIQFLLNLNALSVMSPEESDHFAKTTPENIKPTNMLDKWKLQDDGSVAAKSRSVLVGWKDPIVYQFERAAPTPTQEGIMVTLQWLASAKVTGRMADPTNVRLARRQEKQTCHTT